MLSGITKGNRPSEIHSRPKIQLSSDLKLISIADGFMTIEQTLEIEFAVKKMDDDCYIKVISGFVESNVNVRYTGAKERHYSRIVELTILSHEIKKT